MALGGAALMKHKTEWTEGRVPPGCRAEVSRSLSRIQLGADDNRFEKPVAQRSKGQGVRADNRGIFGRRLPRELT